MKNVENNDSTKNIFFFALVQIRKILSGNLVKVQKTRVVVGVTLFY